VPDGWRSAKINTAMERFGFTSSRSSRTAKGLFALALAFWPAFALLTVLEEKAGLAWLRTESRTFWAPIAALALLSAVVAPLLLKLTIPRKIIASICSLLGFALVYGVVAFIGASFLNWGD
jgi:hypothetical protein